MKRKLFTLSLITLLTACGGGGGGSSSSNEAPRTVNKPNMPAQTAQKGTAQKQDQSKPAQPQSQDPQVNQPNNIQPQVAQPVEPQATPENSEKFYTEGFTQGVMKNEDDPLTLSIDIYQGKKEDYVGAPKLEKQKTEQVVLSGSTIKTDATVTTGDGANYYFIPAGDFNNGYIGFYRINENGANQNFVPNYVITANNSKLDNNTANLNATFSQPEGVIYSPKNLPAGDGRQAFFKKGDISVTFKEGKAEGYVNTPASEKAEGFAKVFDISGDVNGLVFKATGRDDEAGGRAFGIPQNATSENNTTKFVNGKDGRYMIGKFSGEKFHGAYFAKEQK